MTGIKHIVAHLEGGAHDAAVLKLSGTLAGRFGAALEGVFASVPPFVPASIDGMLTPQIIEAQQNIYKQRAEAAKKAFAGVAVPQGKAIWTQVEGMTADAVLARARYADLTVVAQPAPEETDAATDYDSPAEIVMGAGRPVLIVPYAGNFPDVGKRVLAAWSGTRESARALADALPFLGASSDVTVLTVNPHGETAAMEADIKRWLGEHGVNAKTRVAHTQDIEVGDVLLSAAADLSADLIVMGAYGRSRLRELILGGATHSIFRHMTAPVLMSH
ncbi:MAG: universal stress protein [Alphaproteobacteria bacterium]